MHLSAVACAMNVSSGHGLTAGGSWYATSPNVTAEACEAECCAAAKCAAFTWHAGGGLCSLTTKPKRSGPLPDTRCGIKAAVPPQATCPPPPPLPRAGKAAPNIVLFLCDDLDATLGGMVPLRQTNALLAARGATARSWFIHTPVCCPSRAELLTGRYFHSIRVANPGERGCMHVNVSTEPGSSFYGDWYFAPHLAKAGYEVAVFGKHLNGDNPRCNPPGVARWFVNGGGSYESPQFDDEGRTAVFRDGYSTSVIGNVSLGWIRRRLAPDSPPFFAYIAVKAPHIQDGPGWPVAIPAPWHRGAFPSLKAPRTPNWNASCPDHHWLIRTQPPMTAEQAERSDALHRSRHGALLAVDDLVAAVVGEIDAADAARPTYFIFTSDHGFRLGQFRMPEGKWNVYENDIRIPFLIRGPGIAAGTAFDYPASNVDTMPTVLGLAGVPTPASMDGRSIVPLLIDDPASLSPAARAVVEAEPEKRWRKAQLIEYYGLGDVVRYEHLEDTQNNTFRALRVIDPDAAAGERNMLYAEFTGWDNWNFTRAASEFELFDMDADPFQLHNKYPAAPAALKARLEATLAAEYRCRGRSCS